jgi:hypothetical protein
MMFLVEQSKWGINNDLKLPFKGGYRCPKVVGGKVGKKKC